MKTVEVTETTSLKELVSLAKQESEVVLMVQKSISSGFRK